MNWCLFSIPLICSAAGALSIFLTVKLLLTSKKLQEKIGKRIDLSEASENLIDERLDRLVEVFKEEIPMASMFLKGSLVEKLKKPAKKELLEALPELKNKMFSPSVIKKLRGYLFLATALGGAIGLIIGILELAIFSYFC